MSDWRDNDDFWTKHDGDYFAYICRESNLEGWWTAYHEWQWRS